jgi:hypothetical protein
MSTIAPRPPPYKRPLFAVAAGLALFLCSSPSVPAAGENPILQAHKAKAEPEGHHHGPGGGD